MSKRLDSLDIAKGIAIFLVVMGHAALVFDTPWWRVAIYSFHMPLFFLVSGAVAGRARDGWGPFVKKNVLTLLVPYFIWALVYLPFKFESLPWIFYASWAALDRVGTNTALWFLPSLFCARLLMEAVMRLVKRIGLPEQLSVLLAAVAAFVVGWSLPRPAIGYPLGLNSAFIALGFMLLGSAARDLLAAVDRLGRLALLPVVGVTAALFVYGTVLRPGEHELVGMFSFQYGNLFWFFWNAVSGCALTLSVSSLLAKAPDSGTVLGMVRHFTVWLGRNTIGVYLIHLPIVRFLVAPKLNELGLDRLSWYGAAIDAALTLAICCALIRVIERYLPSLFGHFGGMKGASAAASAVAVVVGEAAPTLDESAARETLKAFAACAVKDGRIDFDETLALLRAVEPLASRFGGAYAEFRDLLLRTRADGVITSEESDELLKAAKEIS